MDTTDADDPKFEYDGQKRAQADGLSPLDVGSRLLDLIPDDLDLGPFTFLGDVVNWMKRAVAKAKKWVVTMAKGVVNFVIQIGADISEFVIDTALGMAQAFGSLMQQVAAAFEALGIPATAILKKLVGFITRKLAWGDVVRMSEFLEGMTNRTLTAVEEFFDKEAVDWVNGTTATLKRHIDTAFDDAERLLKGFDPFNPSDIKASSDAGIASATRFAAANKVAIGTVTRQIESNKDRVAQAAISPDRSDPGLAPVVAYITDALWPKIKQHFGTLVSDIEPMFSNGTDGLLKHGLVGMLRAGKTLLELCIDLASGLLNVVLKVVAALFRLIRSVLNAPVYLPVISEFWNWSLPDDYRSEARHSELSILRMMTAAVALPVTLMHKAFHGALPDLRDVDRKMADGGLSWSGLLRGAAAVGDEVPLLRSLRSAGASANTETKDLTSAQRAALLLVAKLMVGDSRASDIQRNGPGDTPKEVEENLKWAAEVWPPRRNLIELILAILGPIARLVDLVCKLVLIPLVTVKRLNDSATAGAVPPLPGVLELLRKVLSLLSKAMKIPKVLNVASTIASIAIATLPGQPSRKDSGGLPVWVQIPALIASVAQAAVGACITVVLGLVDAATSMTPFAHFVSELLHCFLEVHLSVVAGVGQIVTFVDRVMSSGAELGIIIPDLIASLLGDVASCLEVVSGCFNWLAALGTATAAEGVGIAIIVVLVALSFLACSGSFVVGLGALAPASVRSGFVVARNLREGVG